MTDATSASPVERELSVEVRAAEACARKMDEGAWRSSDNEAEAAELKYRRWAARACIAFARTPKVYQKTILKFSASASAADAHGIVEALRPFVKEAERLLPKLSHLSDEHVMRPTITLGELRVLLDAARSAAGEVGS